MPSAAAGEALEQVEERKLLPLRFLAQVNFSEMPPLDGFPTKGILQFYIAGENAHGLNFENPEEQKGFRVIYHEEVVEDETALLSVLPTEGVEYPDGFPVDGELRLNFEKSSMPMGAETIVSINCCWMPITRRIPMHGWPLWTEPRRMSWIRFTTNVDMGGHRMGGYPFFTQLDPREYHQELKEIQSCCSSWIQMKLMTIRSCGGIPACAISLSVRRTWLNGILSRVLYHWDCY